MTLGEMKLWLKKLEEKIYVQRIVKPVDLIGETVASIQKTLSRSGLEILIFFESLKWIGVGIDRGYGDDRPEADWEYLSFDLYHEAEIFADAGVITAEEAVLAKEYTEKVRQLEWEDRERKLYESLKEKFEK